MYTLVQHSGYGYGKREDFRRAVEHVDISLLTSREVGRIVKAGGRTYPTYDEAEAAQETENYPPDHSGGLVAAVKGRFHPVLKVQELAVYIPVPVST